MIYVFIPLCKIAGKVTGYPFTLYTVSGYPAVLLAVAVLSLAMTAALFLLKIALNTVGAVCSALVLPLSFLNAVYSLSYGDSFGVVFTLICCGCALAVFLKYARFAVSKIIAVIFFVFMVLLWWTEFFIVSVFGNLSCDTVVKSFDSPKNTYVAEVIDDDQGALGGNTYVDIRKKGETIPLLVGEFSKAPLRVYTGKWGEYETIQIRWVDEHTLVINGKQYPVKE